jgi:hypothetical protein
MVTGFPVERNHSQVVDINKAAIQARVISQLLFQYKQGKQQFYFLL